MSNPSDISQKESSHWSNWFTQIEFWILFFFCMRLIGITNAPLETGHNWRQSLTNMIARNFYELEANLLYPRVDMGGSLTGIMGSEFPLFNYLIYLAAEVFSYDHWYGRLINLIVSSIGIWYFYKAVNLLTSRQVAFNSTLIFLTSVWFAFSRKIMPDTFSIALMLIGLYYALLYLRNGERKNLALFFVLATLGMLCKIPALSLMAVLGVIFIIKEIPVVRKRNLLIAGAIGVAITSVWYFYWVPYLLETYKYQLFFPHGIWEGILAIIPVWDQFLQKFYFSGLHSFVAFVFVVWGVYWLVKKNHPVFKWGVLLVSLVFLAFIVKTGRVFSTHNYYIIPFVPVLAFLAGGALTQMKLKMQYFFLLVIGVEGIANQNHDFFVRDDQLYKLELAAVTQDFIPENSLVVINGSPSPQLMYFAHCKGWNAYNEEINNWAVLDSIYQDGASYMIVDLHSYSNYAPKSIPVFKNDDFVIENLDKVFQK